MKITREIFPTRDMSDCQQTVIRCEDADADQWSVYEVHQTTDGHYEDVWIADFRTRYLAVEYVTMVGRETNE